VIAAPSTSRTEQPNPKPKAEGPIHQLFADARRALAQRINTPAPPRKRKRSGDDEARAADLRKQIKRLFRKVRRHVADDPRDDRSTVDNDWWHWHRQSMADPGSSPGQASHDHDRSLHQRGPNYPSPTL
jgi:hypothetical protein